MKAPKNFYNTVDQSKLGIDDLFTRTAENEADIAAIEEVIENLPEITPVEANPDEPITGVLNSVKIGDTNYRVRDDAKITTIKKLNILLTGSNDGYNIALGKVVIYNSITGEYYTFINGTDTIACDKPYHDSNINNCLYGTPGTDCRVYKNQGAPTFTITFGNDLNIERYDTLAIYSTSPVSMCANNVKVAISPDGETFVDTIDKNMTWLNSTATPNEIGKIYEITDPVIDAITTQIGTIEDDVSDLETVVGDINGGLVKDVNDLKDASEQYHDDIADLKTADITINNRIDGHLLAETTTGADEGKIMSVDSNGDWILATPDKELPTFSSADVGKVLSINASGNLEWVTPT